MNYIKELYYGNLAPANQKIIKNSEYAKASDSCGRLYKELKQKLSEEDIETLDEFSGANFDLLALTAEENYAKGFRDGARLMIDILSGENEKTSYWYAI